MPVTIYGSQVGSDLEPRIAQVSRFDLAAQYFSRQTPPHDVTLGYQFIAERLGGDQLLS